MSKSYFVMHYYWYRASDKPPNESDESETKSIQEKKTEEIVEKTVTLDDLKKKEKPYEVMRPRTQKDLDAQYAADKARQALETPGETEARLKREVEPIFKEIADLDQMKYEIEEYHKEQVGCNTSKM